MAEPTIETIRGAPTEEQAASLREFWSEHGLLQEAEAEERLSQVIGVLRGTEGEIAGTSSVFPDAVPALGGRRFWIFRSFTVPGREGAREPLLTAAFDALADAFDAGDSSAPIGVCLLVGDRAEMERMPDAYWPDSQFVYAGYLANGAQVRIRYFWWARI